MQASKMCKTAKLSKFGKLVEKNPDHFPSFGSVEKERHCPNLQTFTSSKSSEIHRGLQASRRVDPTLSQLSLSKSSKPLKIVIRERIYPPPLASPGPWLSGLLASWGYSCPLGGAQKPRKNQGFRVLGLSWSILGLSWDILAYIAPTDVQLGGILAHHGPSYGHLGAILGPSWGHSGPFRWRWTSKNVNFP